MTAKAAETAPGRAKHRDQKQKSPPRPEPGGQEEGGRHYGLIR